tara:strand:+ start:376 stop:591 length:216 start_codon:yes stop_codon:yes gene_type:complete
MNLSDLTMKDVEHIGEIITAGCESFVDNAGLDNFMTEEELIKAERILIDFELTLRKLVKKQQNLHPKTNKQ